LVIEKINTAEICQLFILWQKNYKNDIIQFLMTTPEWGVLCTLFYYKSSCEKAENTTFYEV
jgi:hypothetical protein